MTSTKSPEELKVVAYSCSLGACDDIARMLRCTPKPCDNLQLVLFTDHDIESLPKPARDWKILPHKTTFEVTGAQGFDWKTITPQRLARMHKLLPQQLPIVKDADIVIWFDGNIVPGDGVDLTQLTKYVTKERPLALFRHPERSTVAEEIRACIRMHKDYPSTLNKQWQQYQKAGFPDNVGLSENGVNVRINDSTTQTFCMDWAHHVLTKSVRDQVSLPFVVWRRQLTWSVLPGRGIRNEWFTYHKHSKSVKVSV